MELCLLLRVFRKYSIQFVVPIQSQIITYYLPENAYSQKHTSAQNTLKRLYFPKIHFYTQTQ